MSADQKIWILLYVLPIRLTRKHLMRLVFAFDLLLFLLFVTNVNLTTNVIIFSLFFAVGVVEIIVGIYLLSRDTEKLLKFYLVARLAFLLLHLSSLVFSIVQLMANSSSFVVAFDHAAQIKADPQLLLAYLNPVIVAQVVFAILAFVHAVWSFSLAKCMTDNHNLDTQVN